MKSKFAHLHTHSHYSLLEALPKIPELVKKARLSGMESLALTDSGNLYGAIEFYKECRKQDIKPIIGVDFYVALRTRHDKEARIDNERSRLVLLAKNLTGYKNLLKLVSASFLEGFYYKPRIDKELIERHKDGLFAILPAVVQTNTLELVGHYKKVFGPDFFLEITHHPETAGHEGKMRERITLAKKEGVPIVAAHDIYYLETADKPTRDTLLAIQGHLRDREIGAFSDGDEDLSFLSIEDMATNFKDTPEAIENALEIARQCNLELELGQWVFPNYVVESGQSYDDELKKIVYQGLRKKKLEKTKEVMDRIEYELEIINDKGYSPYFLVAADLLDYAHKHGILTNTRGSAAGSMVTYLSGITTVDPIKFALPFERFLNPDRPSPPDVDLDIADDRRDELIDYARQKYGTDNVAQIGTFGTMLARGAVRDVTRALGFSYALGDKIAKLIPLGAQGFPMTLDRAMRENPELKKLYDSDQETKTIIDMAKAIEGNARHISVHAAGVVISPKPLVEYTPLQYDTKGEAKVITQYDMYSIEEAGLLKFDFLGIRNLSIIAETLTRIEKIEGKKISTEDIPTDDNKTFEMLARGETEGIFQLSGSGMTRALIDLKPSNINDINVMVALYRPGPMDNIKEYTERKHGRKQISYLHPKMEKFLDTTYGVLVYQEDLLMTAIEVAGYSWGEVDKFRKAVGKKIPEEMRKQHIIFVEGCQKHGHMSKEGAEALWKLFEPFQGYGFNKAHAASYGHVAYLTAYLKANFPAIYMSAVLTAESGDIDKVGIVIKECRRMGIDVLPPSINESFSRFTVVNTKPYKIRFGLTSIKNFGEGISGSITAERKLNGKFKNLADFLSRIKDKNLNKKSLESLIKCGALDDLPVNKAGPGDRGLLLSNIDSLLEYHKERVSTPKNQDSLFSLMDDTSSLPEIRLAPAPPAGKNDKLLWEKELLGLYISGHPLDTHREKLGKLDTNINDLTKFSEGQGAVVAGMVENIRDVLTKNNERMTFLRLADLSGGIEVAIFPKIFKEFQELIKPDACLAFKGRISKRRGETSFVAEKIKAL